MGVNSNPAFGQAVFDIQADPFNAEGLIQRQGTATRLMQTRKCPCISRGRVNLHCAVCGGRGVLLDFQKNVTVVEENSPHKGADEVFPFWTPVRKVHKVVKRQQAALGGDRAVKVIGFDDDSIEIDSLPGCPPFRHEPIAVSYDYDNWDLVVDEDSEHKDGSFFVDTIATEAKIRNSSNPFGIHGDIVEVSKLRNDTQDIDYDVKSFSRRTILIDDKNGAEIAPLAADVLQVTYRFVKPIQVITERIDLANAIQKWTEDRKEGEMMVALPAGFNIGKGDVMTFLVPRLKMNEVITRGADDRDELPQFDIYEIVDEIVDEDGVKYTPDADFRLENYNDLAWLAGGSSPATGKRFTVLFLFRPSFKIYRQNIDTMTSENKYFPHFVKIRFLPRWTNKDLVKELF